MRVPAQVAIATVLLAASSQAAYHYVHYPSRTNLTPIFEKFNLASLPNNTVTFFVADQPNTFSPNETLGSVLSQIRQAAAAWNAVAVSDLRVAFGGMEMYTDNPTTTRPGNGQPSAATPGGDVIFIDTPGVLGLGAPTTSTTLAQSPNGAFYPIVRGLVMISRDSTQQPWPSYSESFFATAVHEIGHALGLQHTWTGSAMSQGVIRTTSRARPLDADDVASLAMLYGKANWQANYGSISGRVTFANNGNGVSLASVVAIAPTGPAVSTLSNPDGTYRIDGLPANFSYSVYAHPLPPDALSADDSGLRRPVDQNNVPFNPSAPFQTIFFAGPAGSLDPARSIAVPISAGATIGDINFSVQPRAAVPTYNVQTYSMITPATRVYGYARTGTVPVTGYPGFIDTTQSTGLVVVQAAAPAILPVPQSVTIMGGFAPATFQPDCSTYPAVCPYSAAPGDFIGLFFLVPPGAGSGPRHMVFNFGNDIYVLPSGVDLVQKGPPVATAAGQNPDGTVTVTGAGFGYDSRVFFDGLQAPQGTFNTADSGLTVTLPQGSSGQTAAVTVYNSDGQNSTILPGAAPPTYTYPASGAPQILTVAPNTLPAGGSALVDITVANMSLVDGQVTVGFGSGDVQVRRVWVLTPTHAVANVSVAANAAPGLSEVSVISGMQVAVMFNSLQIQQARPGQPEIVATSNGSDPNQQTIFAGNFVTIFGQNLGAPANAVQVTLNDSPMIVVFANNNQVNFMVAPGFPAGPATLKLTSPGGAPLPVELQIDNPPPAISSITTLANTPLAGNPVAAGDTLQLLVTGLDPSVAANRQRLKVTIAGMEMTIQLINPLGIGVYQIQIAVNQSFAASQVPLAVWADGVSSAPVNITIR